MLDNLIDEYTAILDKDPLDQMGSTDVILRNFAEKIIKQTISDLGQSNYYKPATVHGIEYNI